MELPWKPIFPSATSREEVLRVREHRDSSRYYLWTFAVKCTVMLVMWGDEYHTCR